ncbi:RNA polymerase sigma factor [Lapidilactobacillus gannanensis]|uniref:RNA polymerase sigma factor n=1 Tax=Lapidilactobacillus gannanensis TaxID=2486002 RepID=A0ABW4BPJ9_9LACO|nr:sigma-70 family RNA polymerase sigma factor [Lapidilactobacillus gannanensis]
MELALIYQTYGEFVFRYLLSLTRDEQLAEELTQETFYQAVKSAHKFKGESQVSTWLCQIAKHLWWQYLRKKPPLSANPNCLIDQPDSQPIPETRLLQQENKMVVFQAIHQLNELSKEVVLLRINGDFSFKEIGEVFDKSENWARVTFFRTKQKIIERMQANEDEQP